MLENDERAKLRAPREILRVEDAKSGQGCVRLLIAPFREPLELP
jgi:hypothetical protein